jgi:hypothetical protein
MADFYQGDLFCRAEEQMVLQKGLGTSSGGGTRREY